jgi:hypothetical protein
MPKRRPARTADRTQDDLSDVAIGQGGRVQFNFESLKLSYANQIQTQAMGRRIFRRRPATSRRARRHASLRHRHEQARRAVVLDVSAATSAPFMVDVRRLTGQSLHL